MWVGGNVGAHRSPPCNRATEGKRRGRVKSKNDSLPKGSAQAMGSMLREISEPER